MNILHLYIILLTSLVVAFIVLYSENNNTANDTKNELRTKIAELNNKNKKLDEKNEYIHKLQRLLYSTNNSTQKSYINPFKNFDVIYYINLDSRPERKSNILHELYYMGVDRTKIKRISGVIDKFGALGCSKAHLNALLDCRDNGYTNCLILEDDFVFKQSKHDTYQLLNNFFDLNFEWDVLMLASFTIEFQKTNFDFLVKVTGGQTTGGYAVNKPFVDTLISNIQNGINLLSNESKPNPKYCIDEYWKVLQKSNKWYTFHPVIGHQRDAYSDIEKRIVSYNDKHEVISKIDEYEYLIFVKTCQHRLDKSLKQRDSLDQLVIKHPIRYYYYLGDPNLKSEFSINEETHTITLKCKDDYLSLAHKFGEILHVINSLLSVNKSFVTANGIFFTDDDIDINADTLYDMLCKNKDIFYWGKVSQSDVYKYTLHIQSKCLESEHINNYVDNNFKVLKEYPIEFRNDAYCAGGGFYVCKTMISILLNESRNFEPFSDTMEDLNYHIDKTDNIIKNVCIFDDANVGTSLKKYGITPTNIDIKNIVHWNGL